MEKVLIRASGPESEIIIGSGIFSEMDKLPGRGVVIVTDHNVKRIYSEVFPCFPVLSVEPGEGSKKLDTIQRLANELLELGIDRSGFILGIGGGVVCDITGFLASVYMRGIRCAYVSTSLLSQVDASCGGKTGVNLGETKNIIGTIRQPEFVICDTSVLKTLSEEEYLSGLAELIKTAVIGDKDLFDLIERNHDKIMDRDPDLMELLITRSVSFKASVVTEDEFENGLRRILNFGHTFGHAVELKYSLRHGFAVAAGMELASEFSFISGLTGHSEKERIISLLERFNLLTEHDIPEAEIERLILHDKKKSGSEIHFVFTTGIGSAVVRKVPVTELISFYKQFRINRKVR